jgi:hypothetical protein
VERARAERESRHMGTDYPGRIHGSTREIEVAPEQRRTRR